MSNKNYNRREIAAAKNAAAEDRVQKHLDRNSRFGATTAEYSKDLTTSLKKDYPWRHLQGEKLRKELKEDRSAARAMQRKKKMKSGGRTKCGVGGYYRGKR